MPSQDSVTHWINRLQTGDHAAVWPLWERYFGELVLRARAALRGKANPGADEEDVALSAFDSFCRSTQQGRFPNLADRDDLWRLLVVFTARKASSLLRNASRHKRGAARSRPRPICRTPRRPATRGAWPRLSVGNRRQSSPPMLPRSISVCLISCPTRAYEPSRRGTWRA